MSLSKDTRCPGSMSRLTTRLPNCTSSMWLGSLPIVDEVLRRTSAQSASRGEDTHALRAIGAVGTARSPTRSAPADRRKQGGPARGLRHAARRPAWHGARPASPSAAARAAHANARTESARRSPAAGSASHLVQPGQPSRAAGAPRARRTLRQPRRPPRTVAERARVCRCARGGPKTGGSRGLRFTRLKNEVQIRAPSAELHARVRARGRTRACGAHAHSLRRRCRSATRSKA